MSCCRYASSRIVQMHDQLWRCYFYQSRYCLLVSAKVPDSWYGFWEYPVRWSCAVCQNVLGSITCNLVSSVLGLLSLGWRFRHVVVLRSMNRLQDLICATRLESISCYAFGTSLCFNCCILPLLATGFLLLWDCTECISNGMAIFIAGFGKGWNLCNIKIGNQLL